MVDGERDDDDEGQDEAQDEGEGFFQAFPLIRDTLVGCEGAAGERVSTIR